MSEKRLRGTVMEVYRKGYAFIKMDTVQTVDRSPLPYQITEDLFLHMRDNPGIEEQLRFGMHIEFEISPDKDPKRKGRLTVYNVRIPRRSG